MPTVRNPQSTFTSIIPDLVVPPRFSLTSLITAPVPSPSAYSLSLSLYVPQPYSYPMMAILGQWFGFDTSNDDSSSQTQSTTPQPGIVISPNSKNKKTSDHDTNDSDTTLRKTKSDELLRDFDVMRFLCRVDERLNEHALPLQQPDLDRLQTLHAQACADNCTLLIDIIDHLELENDKLRHRLAVPSPSSAAADALRAQRNMLVC